MHVDDLAAVMLADAELLPSDGDDTVAGHPAADPVITGTPLGQRAEVGRRAGIGGPGGEPFGRGAPPYRLVRPVGVFDDPAVDGLLCGRQAGERGAIEQLLAQGAVKPLDLAGGGR